MDIFTHFTHINALVTGATNQIGYFLLPRLHAAGFAVTGYSRQTLPNMRGIHWQPIDLLTTAIHITQPSILFHIAPLSLLPLVLARLPEDAPLLRVIAFSSTSRFTKVHSSDPREQEIAAQLAIAEQETLTQCEARNIPWTIFRPTLVYGCGKDHNVTAIARFIQRFGFFPIVGEARGLRQPVHADDLAAACIEACTVPASYNQAYNLSGGQTLSYHDMIITIFQHLGKKPRIASIPFGLFKFCLRSLAWLPAYAHLSEAMLMRMNQDLCFDHNQAIQDFGYKPRPFKDNDLGLQRNS